MTDGSRPDIVLEAVCCSADDCVEAEAGGANRIELCGAMMVGGLTPTLGTLEEARARTRLPMVCMIRPRAGGFCYTEAEFAAMRRDARWLLSHGADGIVFGVLQQDGTVDAVRCRELVQLAAAAGRAAVFHRAFDVAPDQLRALDTLIDAGVTRILTSGGEPTALAGAGRIAALIARAAGRIEILPGGGVRADNVGELLRATRARQVHLGPFRLVSDGSGRANPRISFSSQQIPPEGAFQLADRDALRRVRTALDGSA
jgi:copper homeostasis protein